MSERLSPAAFKLILKHEVGGGEVYYNARLKRPTWPGGASGVTIGIGYDLGYTSPLRFLKDWSPLPALDRNRLSATIGICGRRAKPLARHLAGTLIIPWSIALEVFEARTLPLYIARTRKAFSFDEDLPPDAFGALVSLVFNRGPALTGRNRQDMQDIEDILKDGVQCGDLKLIARQLREMKSIWAGQGLDGLLRRREDEAKLVEGAGC